VQLASVAGTTTYTDQTALPSTSYSYTVKAFDGAANVSGASNAASVTTPAQTACVVRFTIANAATVTGQNLYVTGNQTALGSWAPASGLALAIQGSGANVPWTGNISLPPNTAVQYKYVKWNGSTATWESNQGTTSGNRELTTPASCSGTIARDDGNFKP
jgi:hypothetical protein